MPLLPVTALYATILAFIMLKLAYQVIQVRQRHKSGLGYKQEDLLIAGRIHGNASEYIPITLILFALAELNGASNIILHGIGIIFIIARIAHARGFLISKGLTHPGRYWGVVATFLTMIILGLINLYLSWPYLL